MAIKKEDAVIEIDKLNKLRGIVTYPHGTAIEERNAYKALLDECLHAFNVIPNRRIKGDLTTYKLASKIEYTFRRFK